MKEVPVSVRIPTELSKKLRESVEQDHFLDLSEALRSIIRQRWYRDKQPFLHELDRMKEEIKDEIRRLRTLMEDSR